MQAVGLWDVGLRRRGEARDVGCRVVGRWVKGVGLQAVKKATGHRVKDAGPEDVDRRKSASGCVKCGRAWCTRVGQEDPGRSVEARTLRGFRLWTKPDKAERGRGEGEQI